MHQWFFDLGRTLSPWYGDEGSGHSFRYWIPSMWNSAAGRIAMGVVTKTRNGFYISRHTRIPACLVAQVGLNSSWVSHIEVPPREGLWAGENHSIGFGDPHTGERAEDNSTNLKRYPTCGAAREALDTILMVQGFILMHQGFVLEGDVGGKIGMVGRNFRVGTNMPAADIESIRQTALAEPAKQVDLGDPDWYLVKKV